MEASSTFPLGHLSLLANVGGLKTSQFLSSYRYILVLHILSFTKLQQSKSNHTNNSIPLIMLITDQVGIGHI